MVLQGASGRRGWGYRVTLNNEFQVFDRAIRPEESELEDCRDAHKAFRKLLNDDEKVRDVRVADFLQGSYARNTMIGSEGKLDVDVVLVTTLHEGQYTADQALHYFDDFLYRKFGSTVEPGGRSIGVEIDGVALDLVPTSAPSEARWNQLRQIEEAFDQHFVVKAAASADDILNPNEILGQTNAIGLVDKWATEPLHIPDRHAQSWQDTHPLYTLSWTQKKNARCGGLFLRVVRAIKWWRQEVSGGPKHPKSYPLEHLVGDYCPDGITSVAEGIVLTLESATQDLAQYAEAGTVPWLDPRGLEPRKNNVMSLVRPEDFGAFWTLLQKAATNAREAFELTSDAAASAEVWQKVLGERFPVPEHGANSGGSGPAGGFTPKRGKPDPKPVRGKFA